MPEYSTLIIYENGRALGPGHSIHEVIRKEGGGRFAHWGESLYFSTSDNSDPNQNGRQYSIRATTPPYLLPLVRNIIYVLIGFALIGAVVGPALTTIFSTMWPIRIWLFVAAILDLTIIIILIDNEVSIVSWYGKLVYVIMFLILLSIFASCFLIYNEVIENSGLSDGKKSTFFNITFFNITLWSAMGTFILLLEVFFRIFPINNTQSLNPGVKFLWPDYVNYPLNTMGYRDRAFVLDKNPRTYRIMVVGDSYTEGAGCCRREVFPGVLEKELNRRLQSAGCLNRVEVYNLGRCGASTVEEVDLILRESPLLKPDLIILAYVLNDPLASPPDIKTYDPPAWVAAIHKIFLEEIHSYAYYWLFIKFTLFKGTVLTSDNYILALHNAQYPGWIAAEKAISKLNKFVRENQWELLTIIYPEFSHKKYPPEIRSVHKLVYDMIQERGLEVIDLLSFYEGIDKNLSAFAFSADDSHPNVIAHNLLGKYLSGLVWDRKSFEHFRVNCESVRQ